MVGAVEVSVLTAVGFVVVGLVAGGIGGMVGIGGGIFVVPALVLIFHVDIKLAVAASLVGIIATSVSSANNEDRVANFRLGILLLAPVAAGALVGGLLGKIIPGDFVAYVFGCALVATAAIFVAERNPPSETPSTPGPSTGPLNARLCGAYVDQATNSVVPYTIKHLGLGGGIAAIAGVLSGLTGVGGGIVMIPTMTMLLGVPYKVAGTTAHFMVGISAVVGATVYLTGDLLVPVLAAMVAIGMIVGANVGSRVGPHVPARLLRMILAVVMVLVAINLILDAAGVET